MANVIIPVEHQAAPKTPLITPSAAPAVNTSKKSAADVWHRGSDNYDTEMDLPEYQDPRVQQQMDEFQKNVMSVSPQQTVEAALRQHEMNVQRSAEYRWNGQERWQGKENEEMRMVNILHAHSFIRQLRRAGIDARLEENRNARVWLNPWSRVGRVGVNAWIQGEAKTVTTLQYPYGPEFSIMRFNEHNLPTNEKYRGWRTALLELVLKDVLTEAEAEKAFGPALGEAGDFYREQLFNHRAIRCGVRLQ